MDSEVVPMHVMPTLRAHNRSKAKSLLQLRCVAVVLDVSDVSYSPCDCDESIWRDPQFVFQRLQNTACDRRLLVYQFEKNG